MEPVFICGHIKTGTSLLTSLLDNHPALLVFPEELFLTSKTSYLKKINKNTYKDFWTVFFKDNQIKKLFGNRSKGFFGNVDYSGFNAKAFRSRCIKETSEYEQEEVDIAIVYNTIFVSFKEVWDSSSKNIWVEKTPMNELNFMFWNKAYPNAKFLYMSRNPIDVYTSIKKKRLKEKVNYSILNFLLNFKTSQRVAFLLQQKYSNHFKIINYEDLISNPQRCMKQISSFLNIKYENSLVIPTKLGKAWHGNSMFENNTSENISKELHREERKKLISDYEKKLIENFILNNKNPIFELSLAKQNFKRYLKVVFIKFRVFLFMQKIKSI
jgi:hypothetical protein